MSAANMRGDQRGYGGKLGEDEEDELMYPHMNKKRKNMRGRKGKYYS